MDIEKVEYGEVGPRSEPSAKVNTTTLNDAIFLGGMGRLTVRRGLDPVEKILLGMGAAVVLSGAGLLYSSLRAKESIKANSQAITEPARTVGDNGDTVNVGADTIGHRVRADSLLYR